MEYCIQLLISSLGTCPNIIFNALMTVIFIERFNYTKFSSKGYIFLVLGIVHAIFGL